MVNIQEKFSGIYNTEDLRSGDIFLDRNKKDDLEWLILGYMTRMLKLGEQLYPVFADKTKPPEPDFITYDVDRKLFVPIEITEVQHPKRRRGDEYKKFQKEEEEWNKLTEEQKEEEFKNTKVTVGRKLLETENVKQQIIYALNEKYLMRYEPSTWLLIYFNIPYGHIAMYGWWHTTMIYIMNEILKKNEELQKPPYSRVLMTDCEGDSMIEIYPKLYTIKEAITKSWGEEHKIDKW